MLYVCIKYSANFVLLDAVVANAATVLSHSKAQVLFTVNIRQKRNKKRNGKMNYAKL